MRPSETGSSAKRRINCDNAARLNSLLTYHAAAIRTAALPAPEHPLHRLSGKKPLHAELLPTAKTSSADGQFFVTVWFHQLMIFRGSGGGSRNCSGRSRRGLSFRTGSSGGPVSRWWRHRFAFTLPLHEHKRGDTLNSSRDTSLCAMNAASARAAAKSARSALGPCNVRLQQSSATYSTSVSNNNQSRIESCLHNRSARARS